MFSIWAKRLQGSVRLPTTAESHGFPRTKLPEALSSYSLPFCTPLLEGIIISEASDPDIVP